MVTRLGGVVHGLIHMVVHIRRAQLFIMDLSPTIEGCAGSEVLGLTTAHTLSTPTPTPSLSKVHFQC
jgi:hypothetical protein